MTLSCRDCGSTVICGTLRLRISDFDSTCFAFAIPGSLPRLQNVRWYVAYNDPRLCRMFPSAVSRRREGIVENRCRSVTASLL